MQAFNASKLFKTMEYGMGIDFEAMPTTLTYLGYIYFFFVKKWDFESW